MATLDALLAALRERTQEFALQQCSAPDPFMLGWHRLARSSTRILQTVGTPPELLSVLRTILVETRSVDAPIDAPITAVGYTLGVLADTVNSHPSSQHWLATRTARNCAHACSAPCTTPRLPRSRL